MKCGDAGTEVLGRIRREERHTLHGRETEYSSLSASKKSTGKKDRRKSLYARYVRRSSNAVEQQADRSTTLVDIF